MADAPSGWPRFARALRKQALMDEMMEAQGVDLPLPSAPATASSKREPIAVSARMRRPAGPGCSPQATGEPAEFCANRAFFTVLKSGK